MHHNRIIEMIRIHIYFTYIGGVMGLESKIASLQIIVMVHRRNLVQHTIISQKDKFRITS